MTLLLDTNILIILFECRVLGFQHPEVKISKRTVAKLLGHYMDRAMRIGVCPFLWSILNKFCKPGGSYCYISALSRVEFLRATISNVLAREKYREWISQQSFQSLEELFNKQFEFLETILKTMYNIYEINVELEDVKLAAELAKRWSRDRNTIKRHAFDILLLAQAVRRGAKLLTTDRTIFMIREKVLQPPPPEPRREGGLRVLYGDPYVLYVAYSG